MKYRLSTGYIGGSRGLVAVPAMLREKNRID